MNRATSRGGRGHSHDRDQSQTVLNMLKNLLPRSQIVGGRTQVLHSRMTVTVIQAPFCQLQPPGGADV